MFAIKNKKSIQIFSTAILMAAILVPINSSQAATFIASEPILRVGNYTQNQGGNSWPTSISNVNAGDIISFMIYYNNNSSETASQTKVRLNLPSGQFTSGSISADVLTGSIVQISGSVSVSFNSSQTLTYIPDSVRWYKNCYSSTLSSLPSPQSGSEIISSSGLNLGDIPAGSVGGCVIARVQVGNNVPNPTPIGSAPTVTTNSASSIYQNYAYLNAAVNPNNASTDFWFEYGTNSSLGTTVGSQSVGSGNSSINGTFNLTGLSSNTTYYFQAVARNSFGTSRGSVLSFTTYQSSQPTPQNQTAPTVSTNSASSITSNSAYLSGSVDPNNSYTNAWFEYGTSASLGYTTGYRSIGNFDYSIDYSTNISSLSPNTTYYYRAVASNSYGTNYGGTLSFYTGNNNNDYSNSQPSITTQSASPVYQNSALLNGSVNPNGGLASAWFQWGTNTNLNNITVAQQIGSGTSYLNYSAALTGLSANTTYYYRAVASNSYGTNYGTTLSFNTLQTSPIVISQPTTPQVIYVQSPSKTETVIISPTSLILLTSNSDKDTIKAGEELSYMVFYKNTSQQKLSNAVLKITLPLEVSLIGSNPRTTSLEGNNLVYQLGDLGINEEGTVNIRVRINNSVRTNDTLIFVAVMNYLDKNNAFHSDSHFLSIAVIGGLSFMASLLNSIGFNPVFFGGLIFGLVVGFLIYWFGIRKKL